MDDGANMWYGALSMITGIIGIMLVLKSAMVEPKSLFNFVLGLLVFAAAFLLRIFHLLYRSDNRS